jgi:hypothetical protein
MGIKDALLKTAKKKLTKFLQQVELVEGEDLPAIVMTTIENETYLKIVSLKAQDGKLVIMREIDGVSLGDIL